MMNIDLRAAEEIIERLRKIARETDNERVRAALEKAIEAVAEQTNYPKAFSKD